MAKAIFVKSARKDYPEHGIKKGDSYYWWKFRYGGKRFSKTQPRRSQLTQSEYYSALYELEDTFSLDYETSPEEVESQVGGVISELENLRDEVESRRENMPEQLQESESGQLLQDRYDALDSAISELEGISFDAPEKEDGQDEDDYRTEYENWIDEILNQVTSALGDCEGVRTLA